MSYYDYEQEPKKKKGLFRRAIGAAAGSLLIPVKDGFGFVPNENDLKRVEGGLDEKGRFLTWPRGIDISNNPIKSEEE